MKSIVWTLRFMILCISSLCFTGYASAENIFSTDWSGAGGSHIIGSSVQLRLSYEVCDVNELCLASYRLFDQRPLYPSDIGQTITVNSSNDSDFNSFVNMLTNGVDDGVLMGTFLLSGGGGFYGYKSESELFGVSNSSQNGIDFQGYTINSFSYTVNALTLNTPGSNKAGDGIWTDYNVNGTLTIDGTPIAPEPISSILFITGGTLLAGRRFIRRKA